jgi:hypothetical protein
MTENEILDLRNELENWKKLACYLADVHAANAVEVLSKKSSSQAAKRRHAGIVETCLTGIKTGMLVGKISCKPEAVIARLEATKAVE